MCKKQKVKNLIITTKLEAKNYLICEQSGDGTDSNCTDNQI